MQWSEFYDRFWDWSDSTRRTRITSLEDVGPGDEIVDAVLEIEDPKVRTQLLRKAMRLGAEFSGDDFINLEDELPYEIYEELGLYAGYSAECPEYNKDDHTWKYFYENCFDWTERIQLTAIASLQTLGEQEQIVEAILEMDTQPPKIKLIELAIEKNIVFQQESLVELDGELPDELLRKLAKMADLAEDYMDFDEVHMTWDDFEYSYDEWDEALTARRISKLNCFGDSESVCEVIMDMPTPALKKALYQKAVLKGVRFTKDQMADMQEGKYQRNAAMVQTEQQLPERERSQAVIKGILAFLGMIAMAVFGAAYVILGAFFVLIKKRSGIPHVKFPHRSSAAKRSKSNGRRCDGNCAACPAHYGYRYGRWYYGHGHQWGCTRGGNGGKIGCTHRD